MPTIMLNSHRGARPPRTIDAGCRSGAVLVEEGTEEVVDAATAPAGLIADGDREDTLCKADVNSALDTAIVLIVVILKVVVTAARRVRLSYSTQFVLRDCDCKHE